MAVAAAALLLGGAIGKSGQFPLHVWLPDAMEGPTPVSALIHAATMVAAGVFLVARMYPLFSHAAVDGVTPSLTVVVWIGVITALMAALIAIAQMDIKRILAYSTVSQLGLMMVSLGVGGVVAGMMHLLAHGFFKALLFLGAGSVIHACHHEQDIRNMRGLRTIMPVTFLAYTIGMLSLSGVPLFFSGAWTKEAILDATSHWPKSHLPHYLMLLGVVLTAFYMTRQMIYVFFGSRGKAAGHAHENRPNMTIPLVVLAVCTIGISLFLTPAWPWLNDYLLGKTPTFDFNDLFHPLLLVSLALVAGGIGAGFFVYRNVTDSDPLEQAQPGLFRFLANRMWLDELYAGTVIALAKLASKFADWMDRYVWDGLARLLAGASQLLALVTKGFDERGINAGVDEGVTGARGVGGFIARRHSGQIQTYLGAIALGMVVLLIIFAWLI
jgi:NADH-quinone oxidoreductase subunit L